MDEPPEPAQEPTSNPGPTPGSPFLHIPVLAAEVVTMLAGPQRDTPGIFVDCTVGGGGHAEALLAAASAASLLGLDRDPEALAAARRRLERFGSRCQLLHRRFGELAAALAEVGAQNAHGHVLGILYDLGVSS